MDEDMRFTQPEKLEAEQTDGDDEEILVFTQPVVAHPSKLFMCWPKGGHQVELKPCSECLVGSLRFKKIDLKKDGSSELEPSINKHRY